MSDATTHSQRTNNAPAEAKKIDIDHLMPGADVIHFGDEQLALGFPEEVVKAWLRAGKQITAWIIPDVRSAHGIAQWALEFPLYYALFLRGAFAAGKTIPVVLHERDWQDLVTYLRVTLLGLTPEEMQAAGVRPDLAEMLRQETEHLALKHGDGRIAQIEDFLTPYFYDDEGVVEYGGMGIKSHGDNTYSIYSLYHAEDRLEEYKLEVPSEQHPPYAAALREASRPADLQPFEVTALGTSNGFDPGGPCSNLLVQVNGRFLLVDAGPYVEATLRHAGVGIDQLAAVVITHAHEDHAVGLSALLASRQRLQLFVTRETAAILRQKLAILNPQVSSPGSLLDDAFDLVLVETGGSYDLFGMGLRFHYTMHSIPCTGVELSVRDNGSDHRVLVVGDHNSRANVEQAAQDGAISYHRAAELVQLYDWQGDLVIADAGGGLIHGKPEDFANNPSANVVYLHVPVLDPASYTLAEPGHRYRIIPERRGPSALERSVARRALSEALAAPDPDALDVMLDAAETHEANRGQVVVRQGDDDRDLYVVLSGELEVVVAGEPAVLRLAQLFAGEIFGEMAAVNDAPRSATVRAATAARLMRIPAHAFSRFVDASTVVTGLPDLWQRRAALGRIGVLRDAAVTTKNRLAKNAVSRTIEPGATLIREGSRSNTVFVLVAGRVQVYKGNEPLLVNGAPIIVEPGSLIGETAPFLKKARNASIVSLDECEVLAIRGKDFKRIVESSPRLFTGISKIVRERQAA